MEYLTAMEATTVPTISAKSLRMRSEKTFWMSMTVSMEFKGRD